MVEKPVQPDIDLRKLTMRQQAFYSNIVALQKAHYPTDNSKINLHETMEKVFP